MKPSTMKKARVLAELTQPELAKLCGVSQSAILQIENGKLRPSENLRRRIVEVLNLTAERVELIEKL